MGRAQTKSTTDEIEELRTATREAHEAVQSLNQVRREATAEAVRVHEEIHKDIDALRDMVRAVWDAKFEDLAMAQLDTHFREFGVEIEKMTDAVFARFDRISNMLLNGTNSATYDDEVASDIEALVAKRVAEGTHGVTFDPPKGKS